MVWIYFILGCSSIVISLLNLIFIIYMIDKFNKQRTIFDHINSILGYSKKMRQSFELLISCVNKMYKPIKTPMKTPINTPIKTPMPCPEISKSLKQITSSIFANPIIKTDLSKTGTLLLDRCLQGICKIVDFNDEFHRKNA
jgi:hypothetical protein